MTTEQKLMSVAEVATILHVSKGTVYRMIRAHEIVYVSVGERKLIPIETVKKMLTPVVAEEVIRKQYPAKSVIRPDSTDPRKALMQAAEALQLAASALSG